MELFRNRFLEICTGWDFNYKLSYYPDDTVLIISFIFLSFYLKFPPIKNTESMNDGIEYGVTIFERSILFYWGTKVKIIDFPWAYHFHKHWILYKNGWRKAPEIIDDHDGRILYYADYQYITSLGEVQKRKVYFYEELREWRWNWLQFFPIPRFRTHSIWVEFNEPIGEEVNSWKGGVLGSGMKILPNETPIQTLRRMEKERKF